MEKIQQEPKKIAPKIPSIPIDNCYKQDFERATLIGIYKELNRRGLLSSDELAMLLERHKA